MVRPKTKAQIFMEEQLKIKEVAESFNEGFEELKLAVRIAQLREKRGLSQTELAAKMHTSTPVISRLENVGRCNISTLKKVAKALDAVLEINIIPKEDKERKGNKINIGI